MCAVVLELRLSNQQMLFLHGNGIMERDPYMQKKDPTWKKILSCIKEFQSLAHFFSNCPLFSVDEYLFKVHIKDTRSYPVGLVLLSVFLSLNKCFPARQFFYKNIIVF